MANAKEEPIDAARIEAPPEDALDNMTKAQLLTVAEDLGLDVTGGDRKDEIRLAIDMALQEQKEAGVAEAMAEAEASLPPPTPGEAGSYRVQEKITVSWGHQMATFNAGTVVSDGSHGPGTIAKLRKAGARLHKVK